MVSSLSILLIHRQVVLLQSASVPSRCTLTLSQPLHQPLELIEAAAFLGQVKYAVDQVHRRGRSSSGRYGHRLRAATTLWPAALGLRGWSRYAGLLHRLLLLSDVVGSHLDLVLLAVLVTAE